MVGLNQVPGMLYMYSTDYMYVPTTLHALYITACTYNTACTIHHCTSLHVIVVIHAFLRTLKGSDVAGKRILFSQCPHRRSEESLQKTASHCKTNLLV